MLTKNVRPHLTRIDIHAIIDGERYKCFYVNPFDEHNINYLQELTYELIRISPLRLSRILKQMLRDIGVMDIFGNLDIPPWDGSPSLPDYVTG